jgi:MFS transporter, FSR family, fosmidomycin resistance protein
MRFIRVLAFDLPMISITDLAERATPASDQRVIGAVSAAHFVSHYYILLLPPLFAFIRADYGVSYTELGLTIAAFNLTSVICQTPMGFLVDRTSARAVLLSGLLLGASAIAVAALIPSFWLLVAMAAVAGIANTVYHPADYALMSQRVSPERMSHAFSFHTFAGLLGSAAAPASLLFMASLFGWRGALMGAAILAFVVAGLVALQRDLKSQHDRPGDTLKPSEHHRSGWGLRLLISAPILSNLIFFVLLAVTSGGIYNYSVVALAALDGTPLAVANAALSGFLFSGALGVLAGGLLASRTVRHGAVAAGGLLAMGLLAAIPAFVRLEAWPLLVVMSAAGFSNGLIMPSRDMIVRAVTPPGSFGKVFGFVTNGFNIGGTIAPPVFGALMDHGLPRAIFLTVAVCSLVAIATVTASSTLRPRGI